MAGFFKNLFNKIANRADVDWDELEADLVSSDLGMQFSMRIVDELRDLGRDVSAEDVVQIARKHISRVLPEDPSPLKPLANGTPTVILVVGVNGTGKTTSSAKLGLHLKNQGHSVMFAAADTFRAAAVEQLERWCQRLDLPIVTGAANADPSSVCYTAHNVAIKENVDFLICDTAGRLHTRNNLMEELTKIRRTIAKQDESAPHKTYIVVDATTGSNALNQAKEFQKAVPIDGLIVTKLDGSGKGGVAVNIYNELGISPHFIGTGEEPEEFSAFSSEHFVNEML